MNNTSLSNSFPDIFSAAFMINNIGAPFAIGLAVGYFAKKMLRLALFIAGGAMVLLFISEYYGMVELSDMQLQQAANTATNLAKSSGSFLMERVSRITSKGVSGTAGFFVGLKLG
jgi:uncharacterized membrane protein (Fun14 family)